MKKKQITITSISIIIFGLVAFWGGTKWEEPRVVAQFQKQQADAAQARRAQMQQNDQMSPQAVRSDVAIGTITAVDGSGATIKMQDGSEKKIVFSGATIVRKTDEIKPSDLSVGQQLTATGKTNSDGTLAVQNISVRSQMQKNQ